MRIAQQRRDRAELGRQSLNANIPHAIDNGPHLTIPDLGHTSTAWVDTWELDGCFNTPLTNDLVEECRDLMGRYMGSNVRADYRCKMATWTLSDDSYRIMNINEVKIICRIEG